ncbi:MAG: AAA family ATPase [Thermoplasmata archaeon]
MSMENPFKFGGLVTGKDFVDRESEVAEIVKGIRSGVNILLFSHRRMGKSSLLAEIMRRHRQEFIFVYVDLYGVVTKTRLVEAFMSAFVGSAYGSLRKVAAGVKDVLRGSRFRLVLNERGEPGIELSFGEPTMPEIQDVLDLPERIAKKRRRRVVIIFDEFQEIGQLDGVALLKAIRSRIQKHKQVSYIFAGSKKHLLLSIFEEREGAFYKSAKPLELGPMPRADFEKFLIGRFAAAGGRLNPEAAKAVVEVCRGNPYYVQQVAHELFNISTRPRWPRDFEAAVSAALAHQSPAFSAVWDSLKSQIQRRYLIAVARESGAAHGSEFIERHRLKSPSHVQKAVRQLDARGLTEEGEIVDPMFALWLRQLTGSQQS